MKQEPRDPSTLLLALLGLGIVTAALGAVAFWYALAARGLVNELAQQGSVVATAQAQAQVEAKRAAEAEAVATQAATATARQLREVLENNQAYSRMVRANQLSNNAQRTLDDLPQTALLLAVESIRVQQESGEEPLPESVQRLRAILGATGGTPLATGQAATSALAVSPDQRWVAAGDEEGKIRVWDLTDLNLAARELAGHRGPVWDMVFSAGNDRLISAGEDGSVRTWDLAGSPDLPADPLVMYSGNEPLYVLALSPDGTRLATGGTNGNLLLWRLGELQEQPQVLTGHTDAVNSLGFSPDGATLASGSDDTTIRLWNSLDGTQVTEFTGHSGFVNLAVFSPDGKWLASGGSDGQVRLWSLTDQTVPSVLLPGHKLAVYALSFSPDSRWLASADDEGAVRLWDVSQPDSGLLLGRHTGNVRGVTFAQGESGPILVSAGYDGEVRLWDYLNADAPPVVLRGHDDAVNLLASRPWNGQLTDLIVTAGYDRSLRVWHMTSPFAEPDRVLRTDAPVVDVLVTPDGAHLLTSAADEPSAQIWDLQTLSVTMTLDQGIVPVSAIALSSDGRRAWTGGRDGSVIAWDVNSGKRIGSVAAEVGAVRVLAENSAGDLLAVGGENGDIQLWQPQLGTPLHKLTGHTATVLGLGFTPDGRTLFSASQDGELRIWDAAQGKLQRVLRGPEQGLLDLAVQPNGSWLVGAGGDGAVWVWNLDAIAFEPAQLRRHRNEVNAVSFSSDGGLFGSAGADAAAYLWNAANPSAEPDSLLGHGSSVNSLAFAPDGTWVATASSDGTVRLWSLSTEALIEEACHTAGRNLSLDEWTQYFPTDVSRYRKTCPALAGPEERGITAP